jgi:hypothetical protein
MLINERNKLVRRTKIFFLQFSNQFFLLKMCPNNSTCHILLIVAGPRIYEVFKKCGRSCHASVKDHDQCKQFTKNGH